MTNALMLSGLLNVLFFLLFFYKESNEEKNMTLVDLKTIRYEEQPIVLEPTKNADILLTAYAKLPFGELVEHLGSKKKLDNGCLERDLSLGCLAAFHNFDVERALSGQINPEAKRFLFWNGTSLPLHLNLDDSEYAKIMLFASEEEWPLNGYGLFTYLKKTPPSNPAYQKLLDTFVLSREYLFFEQLLKSMQPKLSFSELLQLLLESDWSLINEIYQQRELAEVQKRKFLLSSAMKGSKLAANSLVASDSSYALLLSDQELLTLIALLSKDRETNYFFIKSVLKTPRNPLLRKTAEKWLGDPVTKMIPLSPPKNVKEIKTKVVSDKNMQVATDYTVQEGDSLWKVARRFNTDTETLKKTNQLQNDKLKPGMKLKVPKAK